MLHKQSTVARAAEFCFNQYSKHNCTTVNQTFCWSQNPTLNTIVISGTAVNGMIH
jgi:hypothetical protein